MAASAKRCDHHIALVRTEVIPSTRTVNLAGEYSKYSENISIHEAENSK